ncbi:citrate synthase family protein [Endothiovibrio diazotrophicus]
MSDKPDTIRSRIWSEEAEPDNPFAARVCRCAGYDVYGDLLGKASWAEYWLLMFTGERPAQWCARLLEDLAVALADPGPRDHSVRAAMNGGLGGSHSAASLIAALGIGAGQLGGARDVYNAMKLWASRGRDLAAWRAALSAPVEAGRIDAWRPSEHPPGFDPYGASCALPVLQTLTHLCSLSRGGALEWLAANRELLEQAAGRPLAMSGVAAAAFLDLGLDEDRAEMLYLILRLPGAAVHALEQRRYGWQNYPFWLDGLELSNDPGPRR